MLIIQLILLGVNQVFNIQHLKQLFFECAALLMLHSQFKLCFVVASVGMWVDVPKNIVPKDNVLKLAPTKIKK